MQLIETFELVMLLSENFNEHTKESCGILALGDMGPCSLHQPLLVLKTTVRIHIKVNI